MKFDSYTRFLKSLLYQECMLAEVEGRPLPDPYQIPSSPTSKHSTTGSDRSNLSTPKKVTQSLPNLSHQLLPCYSIVALVGPRDLHNHRLADRIRELALLLKHSRPSPNTQGTLKHPTKKSAE